MSTNSNQANLPRTDPRGEEDLSPGPANAGESQRSRARDADGARPRHDGSDPVTRSVDQLRELFKKPATGAAISGSVVLGAAALFGVLETTLAAGAAFVAYRAMRKRCSTERR